MLRGLGVDRAIGYGVLTRLWSVLAGPLTIMLIATKFTKVQQGFYYTFASLLALQVFFELGLVTVIAQFASHEFTNLKWGYKGNVEGDSYSCSRLLNLLCKAMIWFGVASLLLVIGLIPAGLIFFHANDNTTPDFAWRIPWMLAVIGTAMNLIVTPFFAVIMGSGDVTTVNHRQMLGGIVGSCISWLAIGLNFGLYAVSAVSAGNILISWSYLVKYKPGLLKLVWNELLSITMKKGNNSISWWGEVWPMQWKIALSWVAGYFIFQLFTPVLFHYHGAVIAGQMGITLSASNALLAICITWMNSRSPEFGKFVAFKKWDELDRLFSRTMIYSVIVAIIGAFICLSCIWYLQEYYTIGQRFLPASQAAMLLVATVATVIIYGFATYLRAHKQEPLLMVSLIGALLQGFATWFLGKYYTSTDVIIGFMSISVFFSLPAVFFVWRSYKRRWHSTNYKSENAGLTRTANH
ncbi:MAG: hypothetical protein JZU65_20770 [Chlorobium sp.]|nr:hypothetical protein [Chlorobium sp.]